MAQYIDKSALVADIRKRLLPVIRDKHYSEWEEGKDSERIAILAIINTLEVKEANSIDTFIEKACNYWYKYNQEMVKRYGSKAILGCSEFTVNVKNFKNYMEGK